MKSIFTFLGMLLFSVVFAQDKVIVHKATASTISADASVLDHPDLNGNPNANFIVTHNLSNGGTQYNDKITGTYYNGSQWYVYNEDSSGMIEGSSYNIYIPQGGKMISAEADGTSYDLQLNDPAINGNPNAVILYATYYNPNSVRNNHNYGFWYSDTTERWSIYNEETTTNIPADAVFTLLVAEGTGGGTSFKHVTSASNNSGGNYTTIDHPSLNGKPEAYPVVSHNWGTNSDPINVILDKTIGVWYNGTNWTIYTEDQSVMPEDVIFNIYVAQPELSVGDEIVTEISSYPNPTSGNVTFTSKEMISNVSVYNILGQEVKQFSGANATNLTINISELAAGNYMAKVQAGKTVQSIKLIKI